MRLYRLYEGNKIYRDRPLTQAVQFDYSGTATEDSSCTPGVDCPADTVHMFTDQNRVTFVDGTTCYNNGNVVDLTADPTCGGAFAPGSVCSENQVFCGPIQITSNYATRLADPILDLANVEDPSPVDGCRSDATTTGLCDENNSSRIDPSVGGLSPAIPGNGGSFRPCAFCYGNYQAAQDQGRSGLADVLVAGADPTLQGINTNLIALALNNGGESLNITLTLYFSLPAFDTAPGTDLILDDGFTSPTCLTRTDPTSVILAGGGFGPPGGCLTGGLPAICSGDTGCCPFGAAGAGHSLTIVGAGTVTPADWSDTIVSATVPGTTTYGCGVRINTPAGNASSVTDILICGNQWRAGWDAQVSRFQPQGGILNGVMVIAGGRSGLGNLNAVTTTSTVPLPSCANPNPLPSTIAAMPAARWGAASAVVSSGASPGLYVFGGTSNGANTLCTTTVYRLPSVGSAWQTVGATLPAPLCNATALALTDGTTGEERIVIIGGVNRPMPRMNYSTAAVLSPNIYIFNPATSTFLAPQAAPGAFARRYSAAGGTSGTVGIIAGGYANTTNPFTSTSVRTETDFVTISNDVVTVTAGPALPSARTLGSIAFINGNFYMNGGSDTGVAVGTTDPNPLPGSNTTRSIPPNGSSWTALANSGDARVGGLSYPLAFDEMVYTDVLRVLTIGGAHRTGTSSTFVVKANEYQP
jgi:hypothetical protein